MKKFTTFIVTGILLITFLSSCQQSTSELLIGDWKMSNYESSVEKDDMEKEIFEEIKKDIVSSQSYHFEVDKLIIKSSGDDISAPWLLSADGKKLTIKLPGTESTVVYEIALITETELKIVQKDDDGNTISSSFLRSK